MTPDQEQKIRDIANLNLPKDKHSPNTFILGAHLQVLTEVVLELAHTGIKIKVYAGGGRGGTKKESEQCSE